MSVRDMKLPESIETREYQLDAATAVVNQWYETGDHGSLLILPTGCGKTITAGIVTQYQIEAMSHKVLFMAHRSKLIQQATNVFQSAFGFATAVEKGEQSEREYAKLTGSEAEVVVATVQSLHSDRLMSRFTPDHFGCIIIDEAHRSGADSYGAVLEYFQGYKLMGITATPDGSKTGIGHRYQSIAYQMRLTQAILDGHLCRVKIRTIPVPINLKEIKTTGGDYNLGDIIERISPHIETIVYNVKPHLGTRQTVVFTPDVGSAKAVAEMFSCMGVPAEYVAGNSGKFGVGTKETEERLTRFERREIQVIVCCEILSEGWDSPQVECVVICRPTKKRYKYVQMVGRGTRQCRSINKTDVLVLDLDWQCDETSRELCKIHELFADGTVDADVVEALGHEIKKRQGSGKTKDEIDVLSLLQELQRDTHYMRMLKVKYTGKHTELYQHTERDPLGVGKVLDLKVRRGKDFDMRGGGPAKPGQIAALNLFGVTGAEKMSLWGAGRLLKKLESREKKGLASHQQVKVMLKAGVDETQAREMKKRDAASVVSEIVSKQGSLF